MELLVIVLNKTEFLNDLLSLMVEAGITHSTILDSEGMGHHLAYEIPIFAGLRQLIGETKAHNKTILALVDSREIIKKLVGFRAGVVESLIKKILNSPK